MKRIIISFILIIGHSLYGQTQTVDNKNYYKFQNEGGSLNWLRSSDAVPIIIDELLKNGIAYYTIGIGDLIKVNDSTRFVLTITFEKNGKDYGFLYEATHGLPLNPKDRDFLTDHRRASYVQAEKDVKSDVDFMRIDPLPNNVFLLKQTCYWFQFDNSGTKYSVSKEVSQNILRQDIKDYLKSI
jgi:hypothetical protein